MKDVSIRLISFMNDHPTGVSNKQIAKHFDLSLCSVTTAERSNTLMSQALKFLLKTDQITKTKGMGRKFNPTIYKLTQDEQIEKAFNKSAITDVDGVAEDELLDAINNFLAIKKAQLVDKIAGDMLEIRRENAQLRSKCEENDLKIAELETKKARKFLNW